VTRAWLTRRRSGEQYLLTRREPVIERVEGTNRFDVYCKPGETVGALLCADGVHAEMGREYPVCTPIRVRFHLEEDEE